MKKYYGVEVMYYVGSTDEIRPVYKSIRRASRENKTEIFSAFCDSAEFSQWKNVYALEINADGAMSVLSSDTMMELIVNGTALEWTEKSDSNIEAVNGVLFDYPWTAETEKMLVYCKPTSGICFEKSFPDFESLKAFVYTVTGNN